MIPFEEILRPLVEDAKRRLLNCVPHALLIPKGALAAAEDHLLSSLSLISGQSFLLEFWFHRRSDGIMSVGEARTTQSYRRFVDGCLDGGLEDIFSRYPELARLVRLTVDQWVANTSELLVRLIRDVKQIHVLLGCKAEPGEITEIATGFSDRHRGGQTVARIAFSSGTHIWYKPKCIEIDRAYNTFLAWCNQEFGWTLRTLTVLPRDEYGWMEDARSFPCKSHDEVRIFFENAGLLLSVIYLLRGSDLHSENLVACGSCPVVVDLEILLQPGRQGPRAAPDNDHPSAGQEEFLVTSTGYLPDRDAHRNHRVYDISGLGAKGTMMTPVRGVRWEYVNTDAMRLEFIDAVLEEGNHLPDFLGRRVDSMDYSNEVVRGFSRGYRSFMGIREQLLDDDGPLAVFALKTIRYLVRSSAAYGSVLRATYNPKYVASRAQRLARLNAFISIDSEAFHGSNAETISRAELDALQQDDIPIFHACSSDADLLTSLGVVREFFSESGLSSVLEGVRRLSELDLQRQQTLISNALNRNAS